MRPRLSDQMFVLVLLGLATLVLLTALTWIGAYSWLFDYGSETIFEVSPGNLGLQSQKLLNAIRDSRSGLVVSNPDVAAAASRMLAAQDAYRYGYLAVVLLGIACGVVGSLIFVRPKHRAQSRHESAANFGMMLASAAAILSRMQRQEPRRRFGVMIDKEPVLGLLVLDSLPSLGDLAGA